MVGDDMKIYEGKFNKKLVNFEKLIEEYFMNVDEADIG